MKMGVPSQSVVCFLLRRERTRETALAVVALYTSKLLQLQAQALIVQQLTKHQDLPGI